MKQKRVVLLTALTLGVFLMIPGLAMAVEAKPGDVIDSSNIEQYKDYFPMFMQRYIKDGWGFEEPVVIKVKAYEPVPYTKLFTEKSKENMKTCKLTPDGLIEGYNGQGIPFMEPKEPNKALKIMWNQFYKCYPDDWVLPESYITVTKRKNSKSVSISDSLYEQLSFSNRTMIEPIPELDNPKQLLYANIIDSRTPPNKDMATLTWRYKDPLKYDDMWTYVPTLRRTLRLVSSERANPVRGTPYTWDDFFGFDGKIPLFEYKLLGEQTVMTLAYQKTWPEKIDRKTFPWHPVLFRGEEWEPVPCYVVEIKSKDPRYPQSKKIVWVYKPKFGCVYAHMYDKAGEFWKGFWNGGQLRSVKTTYGEEPYAIQTSSGVTDFKTFYWVFSLTGRLDMNVGSEPGVFQPGSLSTF